MVRRVRRVARKRRRTRGNRRPTRQGNDIAVNPQAFDLITRSVTTALLAVGILLVAAYEVITSGTIDSQFGAFVGLVLGFYFGAHVSQNGSAMRARRDQIITAEARGEQPPPPVTTATPSV